MSFDLFSEEPVLTRIPMEDADVFYMRKVPLPYDDKDVLRRLINETEWRSERIFIWGKEREQPRLIAWYGDEDKAYKYSGIRLTPSQWSPLLLALKKAVEGVVGASFNSVLLNYYRNERDSIGEHSDDEPELGAKPVIASLSFGAERVFILKHKSRKELKAIKLSLEAGSLLLMQGETQLHWRHRIDKQKTSCGPRVNLTFRQIS